VIKQSNLKSFSPDLSPMEAYEFAGLDEEWLNSMKKELNNE
jgi:hypothetical protein